MYSRLTETIRKVDPRSPVVAALIVFALAAPALAVLKSNGTPDYAVSKRQAAAIARDDTQVRRDLADRNLTEVKVTALDDREQRVTFFDGARPIVDVAVAPRGVTNIANHAEGVPESGSSIANAASMLALLTLLFMLATLTVPLLSLRNLDVLALASFTAVIVLLNDNLVLDSVYASYPPLLYLAGRCIGFGLGRVRGTPATSLLWHLARGWPRTNPTRMLRLVVLAAGATVAMVVPSSTGATDVAYAAGAGATDLLHGVSPYGHIPHFIFHGDTYPLLTYALYIPGAALMPVRDSFSDPTGALLVAAVATLLAAYGLFRIGTALSDSVEADGLVEREPARFAGLRLALAWLSFPPVLLAASGGSNDPVLAACLVAAFACFSRRGASTVLIGVAAWVKVIPVLALPIWLARMSARAALRTLTALAALCGVLVGWLLVLGGPGAVEGMLHGLTFQLQRGSLHSLWLGLNLTTLQPLATALVIAAIAAATVAVRRDLTLRDDPRRMAALFGAVMLLAQIGANYWTWAYLPWALVPILLSLLAPAPIPALATATATRRRRRWLPAAATPAPNP